MVIPDGFIARKLNLFTDSKGADSRKSLVISILIYALLLLLLFFIRFWPPSNSTELVGGGGGGGMTINFGDSDLGSGKDYNSKNQVPLKDVKTTKVVPNVNENIISQDNSTEESVAIVKDEKIIKIEFY